MRDEHDFGESSPSPYAGMCAEGTAAVKGSKALEKAARKELETKNGAAVTDGMLDEMAGEANKRKRAKAKSGSGNGKTEDIHFRVYPHEKEEVERAADELGLSIGDVLMLPFAADIRIRDGITQGPLGADEARRLGVSEIVVVTEDEVRALVNAVNRYGGNLNQATRSLNRIASTNRISDFSLSLAVNDIRTLLEDASVEFDYLRELATEIDGIQPFRIGKGKSKASLKDAEAGEGGR